MWVSPNLLLRAVASFFQGSFRSFLLSSLLDIGDSFSAWNRFPHHALCSDTDTVLSSGREFLSSLTGFLVIWKSSDVFSAFLACRPALFVSDIFDPPVTSDPPVDQKIVGRHRFTCRISDFYNRGVNRVSPYIPSRPPPPLKE